MKYPKQSVKYKPAESGYCFVEFMITQYERYTAKCGGWRHGAANTAMQLDAFDDDELMKIYDAAYLEGEHARQDASARAATEFGIIEKFVHAA